MLVQDLIEAQLWSPERIRTGSQERREASWPSTAVCEGGVPDTAQRRSRSFVSVQEEQSGCKVAVRLAQSVSE